MSKVFYCPLPATSALHQMHAPDDFLDCYRVASNMAPRPAAEIITNFPDWVRPLLALRGLITSPFGLKQSDNNDVDSVGPFPVVSDTDHELIAGFDDKHLNFRVSVLQQDGHVHLATWVHVNNLGGRIYLTSIMPFHIAIARNALSRVARHTISGQSQRDTVEAL